MCNIEFLDRHITLLLSHFREIIPIFMSQSDKVCFIHNILAQSLVVEIYSVSVVNRAMLICLLQDQENKEFHKRKQDLLVFFSLSSTTSKISITISCEDESVIIRIE